MTGSEKDHTHLQFSHIYASDLCGKIDNSQYYYLYPTLENVPKLYCTPKIHKPNTPPPPHCGLYWDDRI